MDWVLYDSTGVIAQGPEDEVRAEMQSVVDGAEVEWVGDLVLAEIKAVHR